MKKVLLILGIILLIGVVYMAVKISGIVRDNTKYDLSPQTSAGVENADGTSLIDQNKEATPSNEEIVARIFPEDEYKKISDVEFEPKTNQGGVGNTYIVNQIERGDIDNDLYNDAFVVVEITGAAGVANTAYLVTRNTVTEGFGDSVLAGRVIYSDGGFTNNKQLFVIFVDAVTGEKERILYDYSVVNGEVVLKKVSSKIIPPEDPQAS